LESRPMREVAATYRNEMYRKHREPSLTRTPMTNPWRTTFAPEPEVANCVQSVGHALNELDLGPRAAQLESNMLTSAYRAYSSGYTV
jgi:hypothetical protein